MIKAVSINVNDVEELERYVKLETHNKTLYVGYHNYYGYDDEKIKAAVWVSYWRARSRGLSLKKQGRYNEGTKEIQPRVTVERFVPEDKDTETILYDEQLKKCN